MEDGSSVLKDQFVCRSRLECWNVGHGGEIKNSSKSNTEGTYYIISATIWAFYNFSCFIMRISLMSTNWRTMTTSVISCSKPSSVVHWNHYKTRNNSLSTRWGGDVSIYLNESISSLLDDSIMQRLTCGNQDACWNQQGLWFHLESIAPMLQWWRMWLSQVCCT